MPDFTSHNSITRSGERRDALPGLGQWELGRLIALADAADLFADGAVSLSEAVAFVVERTAGAGLIADASLATFGRVWHGFARYARLACEASTLDEVTPSVVTRYMVAPTSSKSAPSAATQQLRRTALRFLFRVLRENGLATLDPTLDLELPTRPSSAVRPLKSHEVELCRLAAPATLIATREPAAWALLETGASTSEIGNVRICDVRLDGGVVLVGHGTAHERIVPLSGWGVTHLRRRSWEIGATDWVLVGTNSAGHNGRRTRATELVRNVMRRAGVTGAGVSARSLTAWAGQQVLADTGRVEDAATRLGLSSLDATATLLGYDWDAR